MTIDLSQLAPPDIIENLDYTSIRQALLDDLTARDALFNAELLESDPAVKLLEVAAYRELLLRQRINDAARAVMLATATAADLDQLAALVGVQRAVITPASPNTIPARDEVKESDERLRVRAQLALESLSVAGTANAYRFHTLSVSPRISDVAVSSPSAGRVKITILPVTGDDGSGLVAAVNTRFDNNLRPLTDHITVALASELAYSVQAQLHSSGEPDSELVKTSAERALRHYAARRRAIGTSITLSSLYAALTVEGVERITLQQPTADLNVTTDQFPELQSLTLSIVKE